MDTYDLPPHVQLLYRLEAHPLPLAQRMQAAFSLLGLVPMWYATTAVPNVAIYMYVLLYMVAWCKVGVPRPYLVGEHLCFAMYVSQVK